MESGAKPSYRPPLKFSWSLPGIRQPCYRRMAICQQLHPTLETHRQDNSIMRLVCTLMGLCTYGLCKYDLPSCRFSFLCPKNPAGIGSLKLPQLFHQQPARGSHPDIATTLRRMSRLCSTHMACSLGWTLAADCSAPGAEEYLIWQHKKKRTKPPLLHQRGSETTCYSMQHDSRGPSKSCRRTAQQFKSKKVHLKKKSTESKT